MSKDNLCDNRKLWQRNTTYWSWTVVLIIVVVAAAIRIRLLDTPLERDEGEYAYAGQLILQGIWPYQTPSLYKYKLPGIYFAYALVLAIFGQTQAGVHAGLLVANLGTIVLLFLAARKLFSPFAAVATAAVYSILSMSPSVLGLFAHAEHFVVLAVVGGILILLQTIDSYRWWKLFLSGLLFGLAFLIRQHGAVFVLFAALYLLFSQFRQPDIHWLKILSRCAIFCLAVATPFLLACVALLAAGVFDKFWFWVFVYARKYVVMMPFSKGVDAFVENMSRIILRSILIWILVGYGVVSLFRNKKMRPQRLFVLAFLGFSFISVCPGFYFRRHYFVLLLPAVALLAGIGAGSVQDFFAGEKSVLAAKVKPILLVLVVIFQAAYQQRNFFFVMGPIAESRAIYGGNPFPESVEIARYIRENSSKNDLVAILGSEPQILFYAQRHSATGYTDMYELTQKHDYALQMQKEMISEIESARPKFLIFVYILTSWMSQPGSEGLILEWFNQYRQKYYKQVGVIDIISQDRTIYRWGDSSINYLPQSKNWLLVLQRKN